MSEIEAIEADIARIEFEIARLQREVRVARDLRSRAVRRERYLSQEVTNTKRNGADQEYIKTQGTLTDAINHWIEEYEAWHGAHAGGQTVLAQRARVSPRTIRRIIHGEQQSTTFTTADMLLTAMNLQDLLPSLEIVPNPRVIQRPESQYWEE